MAQCNLGDCYRDGTGVTKDKSLARKWYQKAAEQGNSYAMDAIDELTFLNRPIGQWFFAVGVHVLIGVVWLIILGVYNWIASKGWSFGVWGICSGVTCVILDLVGWYNRDDKNAKRMFLTMGIFVVILAVFFMIKKRNKVDANNSDNVSLVSHQIDTIRASNSLGEYRFVGETDDYGLPHGQGKAWFDDGRYYEGDFVDGDFADGEKAFFKYDNGDTFEGEFHDNMFDRGVYTSAEDGAYFIGSFKDGQPNLNDGEWYDKYGNLIE